MRALPPTWVLVLLPVLVLAGLDASVAGDRQDPSIDEHKATRDLVAMVKDAASLFAAKGEAAFAEFAQAGQPLASGRAP